MRLPRPRLLIIGPLPPPYAGPEIGTEIFLRSRVLGQHFLLGHINTTVRASNVEKGRMDVKMVLAYVRYLGRLLSAMLVFRPDYILYRPTSATRLGWIRDGTTILCGVVFGFRVILQFGGGHFRHFHDSLGPVSRRVLAWLLGRSYLVLPESPSLRRQFAGIVPEDRVGELPTSITEEFFERFEGYRRSRHGQPLNVLFIGHLSQAKGYCDILRAIPAVASHFDVRFSFMGAHQPIERNVFFNQATGERIQREDPDQCYAEHVVRNHLEDRVQFLGDRVFGEDKVRTFEAADIFVLPSYSEGFSRSVLEAMAAGLPMVVTRVGAVPDTVTDGVSAFVVEPGDVDELTRRVETLLGDPGLRLAMGAAGRQRCRERYLAEGVSLRLVEILSSTPPAAGSGRKRECGAAPASDSQN
jgi:glycosyltransferase involved in cell wall biosynthesis